MRRNRNVREVVILNEVVRNGLPKEVIFERREKFRQHRGFGIEYVLGRGNSI